MLNPRMIEMPGYEDMMQENLTKIPIYTSEWTNFNPSDPGITMLENLTAYQILQSNRMETIPDAVKSELLKLLGYTPRNLQPANVYIEPEGLREDTVIPADSRFYVGDICFETTLERKINASRILKIFSVCGDAVTDVSFLRDKDMVRNILAFGENPAPGACLYFLMDVPPAPGEQCVIHVTTGGSTVRNPFAGGEEDPIFASIRWESYCEDGFIPMEAEDATHGFLVDGNISFTQPEGHTPVEYEHEGFKGFVFRAYLARADYDVTPRLVHVSGFLFPARQKETLAMSYSYQKASEVSLNCALAEEGYMRVFAKESKGSSYYMYEEWLGDDAQGRYYRRERDAEGGMRIHFDKDTYGYGPEKVKNAVKLVVYSEEIMRKYHLGVCLGCDEQEILLPVKGVVPDTFALIAQRFDANGTPIYDFVKPGRNGDGNLSYYLFGNEGKIRILDPGDYIGANLYVASFAVTLGKDGNVRPFNQFVPRERKLKDIRFFNPASGEGGRSQETLDDVRRRYIRDLHSPLSLVTMKDYEKAVNSIPGLCEMKVHAWFEEEKNEVNVTAVPTFGNSFHKLPPSYMQAIERKLDEYRLLSTKVRVVQPIYSRVSVRGTVYIKPHYEDAYRLIEQTISRQINSVTGTGGFGEPLKFDRVFVAVEALDCVAYVRDLQLEVLGQSNVRMEGSDIYPAQNALLVSGDFRMEVITVPELN